MWTLKILLHLYWKLLLVNVNASLELVVDSLVLHDPDPRHLLEHFLPRERLQAIDLQLWIPEILESLG